MHRIPVLALVCAILGAAEPADAQPVMNEDFSGAAARERWSAEPTVVIQALPGGNQVMRVPNPASEKVVVYHGLKLDGLPGRTLELSASVKAEGVTAPAVDYKGIRVQLRIETPAGTVYGMVHAGQGTFDWKTFTCRKLIPPDASKVGVMLGLDGSQGTVWFDDVQVRVVAP